jgi:hypothetical protein
MPSSTSGSEAFARSARVAFLCGLLVLLVSYEVLVREAERRWGLRPARIAARQTGTPNLDMFLEDLAGGKRYRAIAVGTSRVENSFRPDILDATLGPAYNLGMGGASSITALEFLDSLNVRPETIVIGISPMDLTPLGIRRGQKAIARRNSVMRTDDGETLAGWMRTATYGLLHGATPERRRDLGQWLQLRRDHGSLLAFLNNEAATGKLDLRQTSGYAPISHIADSVEFAQPEWSTIPEEYLSGREEIAARLIGNVRHFRARGSAVVLVRIPTAARVRQSEDADTSFASDVLTISHASGAPYIDGAALMGTAFVNDRTNFTDAEHMNETGAGRFSRALAERLRDSVARGKAR